MEMETFVRLTGLAALVGFGIVLASGFLRRRIRHAATRRIHEFGGIVAVTMLIAHLASVFQMTMGFQWWNLVIPLGEPSGHPAAMWGAIAVDALLAPQIISWLRRWFKQCITYRSWQWVHRAWAIGSVPMLLHGILAGPDSGAFIMRLGYAVLIIGLVILATQRLMLPKTTHEDKIVHIVHNIALGVAMFVLILTTGTTTGIADTQQTKQASIPTLTLRLQGNHMVDSANHIVTLRGASRWSLEFSCGGDGHFAVSDFQAMRAWGMNAVRIPLNSGYWLGVGCNASAYQQLVKNAVSNAEAAGLYPILVGQWSQHGHNSPMAYPEERAFFTQLADTFKSDPLVSFVPVTEPHDVSWDQWFNGWNGGPGMAEIVTTFLAHAPGHILWVNGLGWGNDMAFLTNGYAITGPNIAYEVHIYQYWNPDPRLDMAHYVITGGEFGVNDANHDYVDAVMSYFEAHQTGYMAWAWAVNSNELLLANINGSPQRGGRNVGGRVHDFILAHAGTAPPIAPPPVNPPPPPVSASYIVQPGDWLSKIASSIGTTWQQLAAWNHLPNPDLIFPGEVLKVSMPVAPPPVNPPTSCTYTVKAGDWLSKIGAALGVPWQSIASWSNLANPDLIYPSEVLTTCAPSHGGYRAIHGATEVQDSDQYTVQPGDTLSDIAARYGASWRDLAAWSNLANPNLIYPGQVIRLHGGATMAATPVPPVVTMSVNHPYNPFPWGQCTWYAQSQTGLAFWGNAGAWLGYAQSHGYAVGSRPVPGAVVVYQGGVQGASWLGHVAIVDHVNGNGSFVVREMNYYGFGGGFGRVSYRTSWTGWGVTFIYG